MSIYTHSWSVLGNVDSVFVLVPIIYLLLTRTQPDKSLYSTVRCGQLDHLIWSTMVQSKKVDFLSVHTSRINGNRFLPIENLSRILISIKLKLNTLLMTWPSEYNDFFFLKRRLLIFKRIFIISWLKPSIYSWERH